MSKANNLVTLDGTNPTLDASDLSYEFEKARIKGATDRTVSKDYIDTEKKIMPENFQYLSSFRDPDTGTSGVAFRDKTSGKTIIAYTGTNPNSDFYNDVIKTDGVSIAFGMGHHYDSAYQFYENVLKENGLNPEDVILTGHSLGGNVAQRVALKYNAPETIVYNAAPLYIPAGLSIFSAKNIAAIESDKASFTGNITRITTKQDPLNNISDLVSGVYVGKEYEKLSNTENGWKKEGGSWYYQENGKLATGWKKVNSNWYHLKENGAMSTGWIKDGSHWYYLKASGEMQTGWLKDKGTWYYLEESGRMKASQWFQVSGKHYYVDASGALAVNTIIDGYRLDSDGVRIGSVS